MWIIKERGLNLAKHAEQIMHMLHYCYMLHHADRQSLWARTKWGRAKATMALRPRVISVGTMQAMKERLTSHTLMESIQESRLVAVFMHVELLLQGWLMKIPIW
jgi:hypothetical protein